MRKKHIQSVITFVLTFVLAIGVFGRTVSASETENKYRVFLKDIGASDEYAHQTGALGISVSISGVSLGFSGGNYDSQAITYRY